MTFPSHTAYTAAIMSDSSTLSQTPAVATGRGASTSYAESLYRL